MFVGAHTKKVLFGGAVLLAARCTPKAEYVELPPPTVTISQIVQQTITEYGEFTGTTEAVESIEIRARVTGYLESVEFREGEDVKAGELLFVIEPEPYRIALKEAEAELARDVAALTNAEWELQRIRRISEMDAAADDEKVDAETGLVTARAEVRASQAAVDRASLNLSYTQVKSPATGRVSRRYVDVGNLVGAGENTLLTTVVKADPIYAYFHVSERELLEFLEAHPSYRKNPYPREPAPLLLGLANEHGYPHAGFVDWADNRVDADTGTIQVRGIFPNPDRVLMPGLFVRIRAEEQTRENALLVSERALSADQGGRFVWVVNEQDIVNKQYVEIGALLDGMRVIEEGLTPADWVIVKGVQHAREGIKVSPVRDVSTNPTTGGIQLSDEGAAP